MQLSHLSLTSLYTAVVLADLSTPMSASGRDRVGLVERTTLQRAMLCYRSSLYNMCHCILQRTLTTYLAAVLRDTVPIIDRTGTLAISQSRHRFYLRQGGMIFTLFICLSVSRITYSKSC